MRNLARCVALAGSLLSLVGCTSRDPYWRTDVWKPMGANAANIAAMAANPYDLIRGQGGDGKQLAKEPADAVTQTWTVKSSAGGSSGGSSGGASGGTGGGTSSGG